MARLNCEHRAVNTSTRERWWTAEAQYHGHARFYLGSVRACGPEAAREALLALHARISPHPAPDIILPVPGRLVLSDDDA